MLKPYQLVGLNWMLLLKHLDVGGCILADEMVRHSAHHSGHVSTKVACRPAAPTIAICDSRFEVGLSRCNMQ